MAPNTVLEAVLVIGTVGTVVETVIVEAKGSARVMVPNVGLES